MSDSTTPQDDAAMSPASTGSLANAHSALQDAEAKIIADGIAEIMRIASEPEWIPVTERLPEPYQTVLAFWKDGGIHTSWVTRCGMWEAHFDDGGRDTVNHWMPLPAPPTDAK